MFLETGIGIERNAVDDVERHVSERQPSQRRSDGHRPVGSVERAGAEERERLRHHTALHGQRAVLAVERLGKLLVPR